MNQKDFVVGDKRYDREDKMHAAYINDAKAMVEYLLTREHRGPGDTIAAAAHRIQTREGIPSTILMRLRHRPMKDMMMSNFVALAAAYRKTIDRIDRAYEHEKSLANNPKILRLADLVVGKASKSEA